MDFKKLDLMMEFSDSLPAATDKGISIPLFKGLHVFASRHSYGHIAVLTVAWAEEEALLLALREEFGFMHTLNARPWYPLRTGKNSAEAIHKLLDFINNELTTDREELINWGSSCGQLQYMLSQVENGDHDIPEDWKRTYREAISK